MDRDRHLRVVKKIWSISYAREDSDAAMRLYNGLKNAGLNEWLDKYKIPPGQNWEYEIQDAIEHSRYIFPYFPLCLYFGACATSMCSMIPFHAFKKILIDRNSTHRWTRQRQVLLDYRLVIRYSIVSCLDSRAYIPFPLISRMSNHIIPTSTGFRAGDAMLKLLIPPPP
jgi:hypothetical protein